MVALDHLGDLVHTGERVGGEDDAHGVLIGATGASASGGGELCEGHGLPLSRQCCARHIVRRWKRFALYDQAGYAPQEVTLEEPAGFDLRSDLAFIRDEVEGIDKRLQRLTTIVFVAPIPWAMLAWLLS